MGYYKRISQLTKKKKRTHNVVTSNKQTASYLRRCRKIIQGIPLGLEGKYVAACNFRWTLIWSG